MSAGQAQNGGRPTKYSHKVGLRLCRLIATTPKGLKHICASSDDFPTPATVFTWLMTHKRFLEIYTKAREAQKEVLYEEMLATASEQEEGLVKITKEIGDGPGKLKRVREVHQRDMTEHRKLKVDTLKWVLARLDPHKYGARVTVDSPQDTLGDLLKEFQTEHRKLARQGIEKLLPSADVTAEVVSPEEQVRAEGNGNH
jgi:hypothetical protein